MTNTSRVRTGKLKSISKELLEDRKERLRKQEQFEQKQKQELIKKYKGRL